MRIFVLILLLRIVSYAVELSSVLCPVTRSPNYALNSDFLYPMEIYHNSSLKSGNADVGTLITCLAKDYKTYRNFTCPSKPLSCPLVEDNIRVGLNLSQHWPKSASLCSTKKSLQDHTKTVKLVVFGGSVTAGVDSQGCCAKPECAKREGESDPRKIVLVERRCAWPNHLGTWLSWYAKATVKVFNGAIPGMTSEMMAERLDEMLFSSMKVGELTSDDIIFLDHSFNDNTLCSQAKQGMLERGLERMVRHLMTLSKGGVPTIILVEADTRMFLNKNTVHCYAAVYERLARHYGLRVFNYAAAMLHPTSVAQQAAYHEYLTHEKNREQHPPWYNHVLYADFIGSLLLHGMEECDREPLTPLPYVIPAALTHLNDSQYCDAKTPPYLRMSYDDIMSNTSIGTFNVSNPDTWKVRLDRKNRGGIISELTNTSDFFAFNEAPITFTLNLTVEELFTSKQEIALQIVYMRSHINSGRMFISQCGTILSKYEVIDALWYDYKTYRYTMPAIHTRHLDRGPCNHVKNRSEPVTLALHHQLELYPEQFTRIGGGMAEYVTDTPRLRHLFKVSSVLVCKYA